MTVEATRTRGRGKGRRSLALIEACTEILTEIQPATVRAVCYRLFTRGFIPSMAKNETNAVGRQLTYARERDLIPWEWIVDETRAIEDVPTWNDPAEFADAVTRSYRRDKWSMQPVYVELWSEKGTVRGTLGPVLEQYEIPFRVMHGFASATVVNKIATKSRTMPQPFVALYVGDWDPSGLHMSEVDLPKRLRDYGAAESLTIVRVALAEQDVAEPDLPAFEAESKRGDPRWRWYVTRYGPSCWELDALSPVILRDRVEAAIVARLDRVTWDRWVTVEVAERESIAATVSAWRGMDLEETGA